MKRCGQTERVIKNNTWNNKKKSNEMHNKKVAVGYFENATYTKDGKSTPVAYVATKNGVWRTMHTPARATIRPSLEKNKAKYFDLINKAIVNSLNKNADFKTGLMIVGKNRELKIYKLKLETYKIHTKP